MQTVLPFTGDNLASCLSNRFTTLEEIKSKYHFEYLEKYLTEIGAKTIVIEDQYISKDYLRDFTSYYSLCFSEYSKFCKRIHFFSLDITPEVFDGLILGKSYEADYKNSYLGFIVVKPIPHTVVGFTVLKTYQDSFERTYWGVKYYSVNLFGYELSVRSLAFQEQDTVVAACATAAIWSMLHGAVQNCNHTIVLKSPSEITLDAGDSSDGSRLFPNRGLEIAQICESISKAGLVSEVKSEPDGIVSGENLRKILNAYAGIGIPIIIVVNIEDSETHGLHAITACGFYKKQSGEVDVSDTMNFMSDNITKFYAHDDQWGPFAKISFTAADDNKLATPWNQDDPDGKPVTVESVIVSVYPKIRITYEEIEVLVRAYDFILSNFINQILQSDLVWDIRLVLNKEYKTFLKTLDPAIYPQKISLLKKNSPKYVWMVSCYVKAERILDISLDATGVNQAMLGMDVIPRLPAKLHAHIIDCLQHNKTEKVLELFKNPSAGRYYDFLLDQLVATSPSA